MSFYCRTDPIFSWRTTTTTTITRAITRDTRIRTNMTMRVIATPMVTATAMVTRATITRTV